MNGTAKTVAAILGVGERSSRLKKELIAEIVDLQADARRYRWLKEKWEQQTVEGTLWLEGFIHMTACSDLDAVIDAETAKEGK